MSEKTMMNTNLRDVQEKVEDSMKTSQDLGRKLLLSYVGMWGLAYDKAQNLWKYSMEFVDTAEKRGEAIELSWNKRFDTLQEKNPDVKKVVVYVEDQVDVVSKNAKSAVAEVEKLLAQFQPKAEEVVKQAKIEVASVADAVAEAIMPGYDELSAKDIVALLGDQPKAKLIEIREYEVKNKNRVTVVREIDAMLESSDVVTA